MILNGMNEDISFYVLINIFKTRETFKCISLFNYSVAENSNTFTKRV